MGKRQNCRGCSDDNLILVLSLGNTPLANAFLKEEDMKKPEAVYPLELYYCKKCHLLQLLEVIDPEILFKEYIYVTGTSETMALHNSKLVDIIMKKQKLVKSDLVLEIASNDGSLLSFFQRNGIRTLGIEPAKNIAAIAREKGIETINYFFDDECVLEVQSNYGYANIVIANNVLAHVDDTVGFLKRALALLKPEGIIVIEVPYLINMLDNLEYDTIYHEHLSYFSILALMKIYASAELSIIQIDRLSVHGGSLRIYASSKFEVQDHHEGIYRMAENEKQYGLTEERTYLDFSDKVHENKNELLRLIRNLHTNGKTIAGYGAPAKGNTLLNYCGIDISLISYTVDKNPLKIGLYTPGMHIPVLDVSTLLERQPDYVLILAWNFAEEIMRQQREYRNQGGRFIIPIPEPRVV
jgi:SAM-dependent methyltransferase